MQLLTKLKEPLIASSMDAVVVAVVVAAVVVAVVVAAVVVAFLPWPTHLLQI